MVVYSDAFQTDWGASGIWSKCESLIKHINYLELLTVKLVMSSLLSGRNHIHVRVMTDNTTVVSYQYINCMGGCRSLECNSLTTIK